MYACKSIVTRMHSVDRDNASQSVFARATWTKLEFSLNTRWRQCRP